MTVEYYDYIVSDDGTIVSKGRWIKQKNRTVWWKEKVLKPTKSREYYFVTIRKNGEQYTRGVHQIVWEAFNGEIPEGYEIDHIDDDPSNNSLSNLQLIKHIDNINKKHRCNLISEIMTNRTDMSIPVLQYKDGVLIAEYPSAHEAARQNNFTRSCISKACKGELITYKGFEWKCKTKHYS